MNEDRGRVAALAAAIYFEQEKNKKKFQSNAKNTSSNWKLSKRKKVLDRR